METRYMPKELGLFNAVFLTVPFDYDISNGDVEVQPSEFPIEYNSESVPDPYTTPIKSIDDDEMDHLLEFFHSEHDGYILDVATHMIQDLLVVSPSSKFIHYLLCCFIIRGSKCCSHKLHVTLFYVRTNQGHCETV